MKKLCFFVNGRRSRFVPASACKLVYNAQRVQPKLKDGVFSSLRSASGCQSSLRSCRVDGLVIFFVLSWESLYSSRGSWVLPIEGELEGVSFTFLMQIYYINFWLSDLLQSAAKCCKVLCDKPLTCSAIKYFCNCCTRAPHLGEDCATGAASLTYWAEGYTHYARAPREGG